MSAVARIMDANANRAREALRVLEDAARLGLNDSELAAALKTMRHDLDAALRRLPPGWLEASRNTAGDVGTAIKAAGEMERRALADVVTAAGRRLGEALRVIEEMGKTIDPQLAAAVEAIRYRLYDVEASLQLRFHGGRAAQWNVCVLLSESACARPWRQVLDLAIEGGADCIQVREKTMEAAELLDRIAEVIERARPAGAAVIVNDRVDVAAAAGAAGAHVGPTDLPLRAARRLVGRTLLLGASTRDLRAAAAAVEAGADYCGVGTMFATATRPGSAPAGPAYLKAFLERHPGMPHLAIGGITPDNAGELIRAGARGVAVCSAVCGAERPDQVVQSLRQAIQSGPRDQPRVQNGESSSCRSTTSSSSSSDRARRQACP